jgi:hypothetical protein
VKNNNKMKLNEQQLTYQDLKSGGWTTVEPNPYNPSDYEKTRGKDESNKTVTWYKRKDGKPVTTTTTTTTTTTPTTQTTDLSQYVGSYKQGVVTGQITNNNGKLNISFHGMDGDLIDVGGGSFEANVPLVSKNAKITFTKDAQGKVNGFDYKFAIISAHADKVDSTSSTSTTNTTTPVKKADESKFDCIKNSNTKGKNLKQTKDNPEAYSFFNNDNSELTFWDNGDFTITDGNGRAIGKWKCKGNNNFEANIEWKGTTLYYRSETNQWSDTPNAKKINENIIKKIVSKNLKSLIK